MKALEHPKERRSICEHPTYLMAARGIVKSYGPTSVLKGFDLSVAAEEVHAFLGGNEAGNSTLIRGAVSTTVCEVQEKVVIDGDALVMATSRSARPE
jgi:ABC-type sugar transport system ATPase subunit